MHVHFCKVLAENKIHIKEVMHARKISPPSPPPILFHILLIFVPNLSWQM